MNASGKAESQLNEITGQATWLKKRDSFNGAFLWSIWLKLVWVMGIVAPDHPILQTLDTVLLIVHLIAFWGLCVLSKGLNACVQLLVTKQMISLHSECQKQDEKKKRPTKGPKFPISQPWISSWRSNLTPTSTNSDSSEWQKFWLIHSKGGDW